MARLIPVTLATLALLGGAATAGEFGPNPTARYGNALSILDSQLAEDSSAIAHRFAESESCTFNLLAPKDEVKEHYHVTHDENVIVLRGQGVFTMGGDKYIVEEGDVIHIGKGTRHSFLPMSQDVVVVSMFSPKFDGKDRVFTGG